LGLGAFVGGGGEAKGKAGQKKIGPVTSSKKIHRNRGVQFCTRKQDCPHRDRVWAENGRGKGMVERERQGSAERFSPRDPAEAKASWRGNAQHSSSKGIERRFLSYERKEKSKSRRKYKEEHREEKNHSVRPIEKRARGGGKNKRETERHDSYQKSVSKTPRDSAKN